MPSWTISDLLRHAKKKHGSCQVSDSRAWQASESKCDIGVTSYGEISTQEIITAPTTVRFIHARKRPLDPDDLFGKYTVDAICRIRDLNDPSWRILEGDTAKHIRIEHYQRKVAKGEPEHFIIEILSNDGTKSGIVC